MPALPADTLEKVERSALGIALVAAVLWALLTGDSTLMLLSA